MNPKTILTEEGWEAVAPDCKGKDKDLLKALFFYWSLEDDDFDFRSKALGKIAALAGALKTAKEVVADPAAVKYLNDMISATKTKQGEMTKAKADAEKAKGLAAKTEATTLKKADAEAKKRDQEGDGEEEDKEEAEEEEAEEDYSGRLLAAFRKLKGAKDQIYQFIVCDAKPHCSVMVAKKITPKHKAELTQITGGSKRFLPVGTCRMEDGRFSFSTDLPVAGLARKLQASIKHFTGKKLALKVGAESVDEDEDPLLDAKNPDARPSAEPSAAKEPLFNATRPFEISASVGRRGKNNPEDVQAVQAALNRRAEAGLPVDGKCDDKTVKAIEEFQKLLGKFKPDGLIEPRRGTARALASSAKLGPPPEPPKPIAPPKLGKATLANAPMVWHSTRNILNTNIEELKKGVRAEYGPEDPELLKQIDDSMVKLSGILGKLDTRLADSLAKANAAGNDAARKAELKIAKTILIDYLKYVKSEPLIAHMDSNPFGVKTNLKQVLTDSLTHMAQAIG
ncbi:MAG: peptidoglycan-binding domain-containing protein [Verrucomicrobiota bacterium]